MVLLRRIIFLIFTIIFFIFSPILVMYALGYFYKSGGTMPGLVKTGLIYLSTVPKDAEVFIGKNRLDYTTPATVRDLVPGEYSVRILETGYIPWDQTISIRSGKASVFDKVILIPEKLESVILTDQAWEDIILSSGNPWLILKKGRVLKDYYYFNLRDETISSLQSENAPLWNDLEVDRIDRSSGSNYILIHGKQKSEVRYLWGKIKENPEWTDLSSLILDVPDRIEWDADEDKLLFTYQKGYLNKLDIHSGTVVPQFLSDVYGYGFYHQHLYALRTGGEFIKMAENGKAQELLLKDPELFSSMFNPTAFVNISVFPKRLFLFLQSNGKLSANRIPYNFVSDGVVGFDYDSKSKKLLIWTSEKIGVLNFAPAEEPEIFEKAPYVKWIYEEGRKIEQAFWVYQDSHVLFKDAHQVSLIESGDHFNPRHVHPITQVKRGTSVFYNEQTGMLYYLEEKRGRLVRMELLPQREISFLSEFDQKPIHSRVEEA